MCLISLANTRKLQIRGGEGAFILPSASFVGADISDHTSRSTCPSGAASLLRPGECGLIPWLTQHHSVPLGSPSAPLQRHAWQGLVLLAAQRDSCQFERQRWEDPMSSGAQGQLEQQDEKPFWFWFWFLNDHVA